MDCLRIATVDPRFVETASSPQLADWHDYFDPDLIALAGQDAAPSGLMQLRRDRAIDAQVVHPGSSESPTTVDGPQDTDLVVATSVEDLQAIHRIEGQDISPDGPTYVLSVLLALDVDTTMLETSLAGRDAYTIALDPDACTSNLVHLSTRLPEGYRRDWADLSVVGAGETPGYADTPLVALDCRPDGRVLSRTVTADRLGLRALDGVGQKRSQTLREAGVTDRAELLEVHKHQLMDLPGVGQTTAERIQNSARAIEQGGIIRESDETLPSGEPVYIDIETDGLSPTITWLIGVLDGSSDDGHYMGFLQEDPDEPGRAIEHFMAWYRGNASARPLVAYGGWNFDFHVLHDHIVEYCPSYESVWNSTYRFDPLDWATSGNAYLPGPTNKLEDVAAALGYKCDEPGLTGAAVARTYQAWMADRSPATEPDWERLTTYCEDDVRALATVYEALEDSSRLESDLSGSGDRTEHSTQQDLSNW